jgi:coatomer subunit beta'
VVKLYKNFVEKPSSLDIPFQVDGLTGGVLLGVKGQGGVSFFDWATGGLVRRIEVEPRQVIWSDSGELVTLACDDTFYVLRYSRENYIEAVQAGQVDEDGVEAAFEVITDIAERYDLFHRRKRLSTNFAIVYGPASGWAIHLSTPIAPTD